MRERSSKRVSWRDGRFLGQTEHNLDELEACQGLFEEVCVQALTEGWHGSIDVELVVVDGSIARATVGSRRKARVRGR